MTISREEILSHVRTTFVEKFRIPAEKVEPSMSLQELDLDSIDMFDLLVSVEKLTGKSLEANDFRDVKTVGELTDTLVRTLAE